MTCRMLLPPEGGDGASSRSSSGSGDGSGSGLQGAADPHVYIDVFDGGKLLPWEGLR